MARKKKASNLEVTREQLIDLFVNELGLTGAGKWTRKKMESSIQSLPDMVDDDTECEDEENQALLDSLLEAVENEVPVEIVVAQEEDDEEEEATEEVVAEEEDEEEEEEEPKPKRGGKKTAGKKTTAKGKGKAAASKSTKGTTKKAKTAKSKEPRKPGVIATIAKHVEKATKRKPISKEQLLEILVDEFPDRESDSMKRTIDVQLPARLRKEKDLNIVRNDKGSYYIDK